MKVLVTGAAGFVGRALLADDRAASHQILPPGRVELELQDQEACRSYLATARPDLIIHLAGRVGGIGANIAAPAAFLEDNLRVGMNLLRAAFEVRTPRLINLGSSCMYPRDRPGALKETDLLTGPLEPTNEAYAMAKLTIWKLVQAMRAARPDLAWVTLIPPNLYGPWDHFQPNRSHMVAAAIVKVMTAQRMGRSKVEIWGDGTARREFMFAADLADFIWTHVAQIDQLPQTMNVGVGTDHSIDDYYRAISQAAGFRGGFVHDATQPTGMRRKLLDVSLQRELGWQPATDLPTGLALTVAHVRSQGPDS